MRNEEWIKLLKLIPPVHQDNLVLVTKVEREIAVQSIVRYEEDYVLLRGRLAGTSDMDRVFWIPYDQIGCVCFQRPVTEKLIAYIYGEGPAPEMPKAAEQPVAEDPLPEPEPAPEPAMVQLPSRSNAAPQMPDKAALLNRIRQRSRTNGSGRMDPDE